LISNLQKKPVAFLFHVGFWDTRLKFDMVKLFDLVKSSTIMELRRHRCAQNTTSYVSVDAKRRASVKKVLITGAGFGYEAAMPLAEKGFDVIATVEIWAQVQTLKRQAAARGVTLKVEKLDVTNEGDRRNAFGWPRAQFNPEPVYATLTAVAAGDVDTYRNLEPKSMLEETKHLIDAPWSKKIRDGLGTRHPSLQRLYEMKPETPVP
jgi:hypothetical protein